MYLERFAATAGAASLNRQQLAADRALVGELQGGLILLGLLDPPVDRVFGPVSAWALENFAAAEGLGEDGRFTAQIARRLVERLAAPAAALDTSSNDFAARAVRAMERRGYWLSRHPECFTIAYFEGANVDGRLNEDAPNEFNDVRLLLRIGPGRRPEIAGAWQATTEPGHYWTLRPMNAAGAARIAFGQYKSWSIGEHHPGSRLAHEALVQVEDLTVFRDLNQDYERAGDRRFTGQYYINQHWGYDQPEHDLGRSSAGCLVGRTKAGHREFIAMLKSDPRYRANRGYRFMTAVLPGAALVETRFDPNDAH